MMIIFLGIPVIMFLLKEPLGQLVEGKKPKAEGGVGMFLVQGFFELFETMLSFFSNTISFVRIGAFAVSHAAMMEVVLMRRDHRWSRKSKLDHHCSWKYYRVWTRRSGCRNSGIASGIL